MANEIILFIEYIAIVGGVTAFFLFLYYFSMNFWDDQAKKRIEIHDRHVTTRAYINKRVSQSKDHEGVEQVISLETKEVA
jgi:hypothetical protein